MEALRRDLAARRSVPEEDLEEIEEWGIVLASLEERQSETKAVDELINDQDRNHNPLAITKWTDE